MTAVDITKVSSEYRTLSTGSMGAETVQNYFLIFEVIHEQSFLKRMSAIIYKNPVISIISVVYAIRLQLFCLGGYVSWLDIAKKQHRHKQTDHGESGNPKKLNYFLHLKSPF